ncbi:MAG: hypothetical protein K2K55_05165 [Duncaniella sp.]|nr:hypothetical protein [Duncaniella sp.]
MKKFILSLLVAAGVCSGASAMGLREAYTALSNIPNVSVTVPDYNLPATGLISDQGELAAAYNLNAEQIKTTGTAAFAILNQIPLDYMINGGNNNEVCVFVYATPSETEGMSDILVATMSGYRGTAVFMYGTVTNEIKDLYQAATLKMEGNFLSYEVTLPDQNEFNIVLSKAR